MKSWRQRRLSVRLVIQSLSEVAMQNDLDSVFRKQRFWWGMLLATYLLPALMAQVPVALTMPLYLIPRVDAGMYEFLKKFGMPDFYDDARLVFAIVFQSLFWTTCFLLIVWGKRLSRRVLRIASVLLVVLIIITIYGCSIAIDAVKH